MTNPNQKIQGAFGDIFTPNTSYTDRLAQQLYAEQKQKEQRTEQMQAALDDQFTKNLLNVRDADSNDINNAYTEFKIANINAMKQKGGIPIEQQKDLLRKKANVFNLINESQTVKKYQGGVLDDMRTKGGKGISYYEPDAQQRLMVHMATPLSKLKETGEAQYDYRYKGQNYKNAALDLEKSKGSSKVTVQGEPIKSSTDALTMETPEYDLPKNTQDDVKNYFLSKMASSPDAKQYYEWQLGNLPQGALTEMEKAYNAITPEEWKLRGGKPNMQHKNIDGIADTFSTYMAQKFAVENPPRFIRNIPKENKSLSKDRAMSDWRTKHNISHADAMRIVSANKSNNIAPETGLTNPVDKIIARGTEKVLIDGKIVDVVRENNISDPEMAIINKKDKNKMQFGVQPIEGVKMPNGETANVFIVDGENLRGEGNRPILRSDAGEEKINTKLNTKQKVKAASDINKPKGGVVKEPKKMKFD